MNLTQGFAAFSDPPREFGPMPFWFWNDELDGEELKRQLRAFAEAGFGGVVLHPRIGLSRQTGYLTEAYFALVRLAVEEAARLGLQVLLYDEASYPSGSACGQVVAENPAYASQAIGLWQREVEGPHDGFWRPNTGRALLDRHVCTVLGRVNGEGCIDPASLQLLDVGRHDIVGIRVGAGRWKVMSVWQTQSGGSIRGAHPEQESGHALAPAAGDLLNPEAVACFLRLTHERYYAHLKDYFGGTVTALFTDEPGVFGKGLQRPRDGQPYTHGFAEWLQTRWGEDPRPWLPALWLDYGPQTARFRARYGQAVQARLREVFYGAQSEWCRRHGIALTGHPANSNEMTALRYFQLPGQDMVWRWVLPGSESARSGAHSVAPKAATSAARMGRRRRVLTEVCGAYGWRHSLDEVKWLFDWHLVRGNNLINPHAAFYSIRGRRAWESEPDIGVHNVFWPYFARLVRYAARLSWLLCDGEHLCDIAILGDGDDLPWDAARRLQEAQLDYLYIDDAALASGEVLSHGSMDSPEGQNATVHLVVGSQRYSTIIVDGDPPLGEAARAQLEKFRAAGGTVYAGANAFDLDALPRDIRLLSETPELRHIHYRKEGLDYYVLVNEGEAAYTGQVRLSIVGALQGWDALRTRQVPLVAHRDGEALCVDIELERRESIVLAVDTRVPFDEPAKLPAVREETHQVQAEWTVRRADGTLIEVAALSDWAQQSGLELFTGTLHYEARVDVPQADEITLDLGGVGDIAQVLLDGEVVASCLWAPYRVDLGHVIPGPHALEIRVTNSMANEYEGVQLPSGLMGPLQWLLRHRQE